MWYDIDGYLVARDSAGEINAAVRLHDATVTIGRAGETGRVTIPAPDAASARHIDRIAGELRKIAYANRPVTPFFKSRPRGRKSAPVIAVPCPECGGVESFHCDTCEGAGVVRG